MFAFKLQISKLLKMDNHICRICHQSNNDDDLIVPCLCKGSSLYVHRACLDKWRLQKKLTHHYHTCSVCKFKYVIESEPDRRHLIKKVFPLEFIVFTIIIFGILFIIAMFIAGMTGLGIFISVFITVILIFYILTFCFFGMYHLSYFDYPACISTGFMGYLAIANIWFKKRHLWHETMLKKIHFKEISKVKDFRRKRRQLVQS